MVHRVDFKEINVRDLRKSDDLRSFRCTSEDLNDYFWNEAKKYSEEDIAKSYVCIYEDKIVGLMSLSCDTIRVRLMPNGIVDGIRHDYPAIKIARLAVHVDYERKGIGTFLVYMAIGIANELSKRIGCRFVTVDSKEDSIGFYKKLGFQMLLDQDRRHYKAMFFDLHLISGRILREETPSLSSFFNMD